jgi:hypothetical protein
MSLRISRPYKNLLIPSSGNLAYNWTLSPNPEGARQDPSGAGLNAFSYQESAFGNDRWVVSSGQTYASQRQLISTSSTADFFDICGNYSPATGVNTTFFANGRFFLGINSTNVIPYSTDGLNWTDVSTPSTVTVGGFTSIPSTGRIVGIGTNVAIYSDNSGNSWNTVSIPTFTGTKIAYNPDADILAAVSVGTTAARSLDKGLTWTKHDISTGSGWFSGIAYGNGFFIAVNRDLRRVWRSTDASDWTLLPSFQTANSAGFVPRTIAFGNNTFVVAMANFANPWPIPPGPLGPGILISNDNGNTWQVQQTQYNINGWANRWQGVTYANGIFVVSAEASSGPYNMTGKPFIPITYITRKIVPKFFKI